MTFQEMMERAENGTLNDTLIKEYSLGLGMRFKIYDVLEDIELGINNMISEKKLKNVRKVTLSGLTDDKTLLGIKFKNDKSKSKYTIVVKCKELITKYQVVDNRAEHVVNPGFFGNLKTLLGRRGLEKKLIEIILENE